jgi:hypothetical protein
MVQAIGGCKHGAGKIKGLAGRQDCRLTRCSLKSDKGTQGQTDEILAPR